jgi:hypothetical protein
MKRLILSLSSVLFNPIQYGAGFRRNTEAGGHQTVANANASPGLPHSRRLNYRKSLVRSSTRPHDRL